MTRALCFPRLVSLLSGIMSLTACSGGDDDDSPEGGSGVVTAPWTEYCIGTFTQDTPIIDPFDEPLFTARAGEQYLMTEYDDGFGRAEFAYLTGAGPDTFTIDQGADGSWPFTSNCTAGEGVPYYAVFANVSVFAEEALTTKICDLTAGTALPSAGGLRGYSNAGAFSLSGPTTYELYLDPFTEQCGGNDTGYISVPSTRSFGSTTWLVPVIGIIGPS
jgi:hypothetical protein